MLWNLPDMSAVEQLLERGGRGTNPNNLEDLTGPRLRMRPTIKLLTECIVPLSELTCWSLGNKHIMRDLTEDQRSCMIGIHATLKSVRQHVQQDIHDVTPEIVRTAIRTICDDARQHLGTPSKTQTAAMIRDRILSIEDKL